jgi:hypothetical protein
MFVTHDIILGTPFLKRYDAVLHVGSQIATFRAGRSLLRVRSTTAEGGEADAPAPPWENADADLRCLAANNVELLSAKETLNLLRPGHRMFAASLTHQ